MKVTDDKVLAVDLSTNFYSEARRRTKEIIDLIEYERYCDQRDHLASSAYSEDKMDEHYEWFNEHMPHLIPYIDSLVISILTAK